MTKLTKIEDQNDIQRGLEIIETKIGDIRKYRDQKTKTNGDFRYTPSSNFTSCDLTKCKDVGQILTVVGFLKNRSELYELGAKEMGLSEYPVFRWQNYELEDWMHDLKHRLDFINSADRLRKLSDAKRLLSNHVSEEQKRQNDLNKVKDLLSSII